MKKILYLLSSLMLVFTACDPMEEVYNELDELKDKTDKSVMTLTLAPADYSTFKSAAPLVATNLAFSSEDQAIELIPNLLATKYGYLGDGAQALVTLRKSVYPGLNNTTSASARVTVSSADYTAIGKTSSNFTSTSDIDTYLNYKYPTPTERQLVALTYKITGADGTVVTEKDSFFFLDGSWKNIYHVSDAEYTSTGNGKYKNFDANSDPYLVSYFNQFLKNHYTNNNLITRVGDIEYVSYTYFGGGTNQRLATMLFDGTNWIEAVSQFEVSTLKFKKKDGKWNVDLTVSYTLVNADYEWIGRDNASPNYGTEESRSNLVRFRSYYTQTVGDTRYWSQEEINKSLVALIKHLYPNPKEGVKYQLFYKIYDGTTKTVPVTFERNSSGEYVVCKTC
jgi:hypothetical protein